MKNCYFSIAFSVVLFFLSGCNKEFYEVEESHPQSVSLSIAEARRYVESQLASRTRSADDSASNTLMLGNYTTDWYRAQTSVGDVLYSVDAPVASEYVYYLVGADSGGNRTLTPMYHKLIVVKDGESEALSSYIRFYLPDREHARTHPRSYYDSLLNSNPKTRFTGMSVYTTLSGFPVAAGRYENSVLTQKEFLFDTLRPQEDNWVRLANLLDGVYVGRARTEGQTRSIADTVIAGDPVEVVGQRPPFKWEDHNFEGGVGGGKELPPIDPYDPSSGGSNSGDGDKDEDKPDSSDYANPKIKTADPEVMRYLNKFLADCMGERLVKSIGDDVTIATGYFTSSRTIPNTLGYRSYRIEMNVSLADYKLMEELIHVNQYTGVTIDAYNSRKLNNEIEAKIGWFLYLSDENRLSGMDRFLGGDQGMEIFRDLAKSVAQKDTHSRDFQNQYINAAQALRSMGGSYASEEKYPFDPNDLTVDKLIELIGDCFKDKYQK